MEYVNVDLGSDHYGINGVCGSRLRTLTLKPLLERISKTSYSIAERHQNYMCLQLLSPPDGSSINYLYRGDEIGNGNV